MLIVGSFSSWLAIRWSEVVFADGQTAVAKGGISYTTQGRTGKRYREVQETRNKNSFPDSQTRLIEGKVRIATDAPLDCFGRLSSLFLECSPLPRAHKTF